LDFPQKHHTTVQTKSTDISREFFSGADHALFGMVAGLSNEDEGTRTTTTIMMAMMVVLMIRNIFMVMFY